MKRYIIIMAAALTASLPAVGQSPVEQVLESVASHNKGLQAVKEQAVADRAEVSAANSLEDLSFDFDYLWNEHRVPGGNRYGFSVKQGFDFPSLYVQRHKVAGAQDELGNRQVQFARQSTLLQVRELCIRLVYLNRQIALVEERVALADSLVALYNRRLEEGDANRMETNKVALERLSQTTRLKLLYSERDAAVASLVAANGGEALPVDAADLSDYPAMQCPATEQDAVALWSDGDASVQLLRQQQELSQLQVSVASQGWIPKFEVGYQQSYEDGTMFYGLAVGISLPLYKTAHEVRAGRARALSQSLQVEEAVAQVSSEASRLYREVSALRDALHDYDVPCYGENRTMLMKALQSGQISLLEYMADIAQLNEIAENRLLIEYQYHSRLSELCRYSL